MKARGNAKERYFAHDFEQKLLVQTLYVVMELLV
jgi:hypothetical protein